VFLAFYIEPDWAGARYGLPAGTPLFSNAAIALDDLLHCGAMQLHDHLRGDWLHDEMVECEIVRLVDRLVAAARPGRGRNAGGHGPACDFRVRKAVELMKSDICERICFDDLARKVGMSRAHFFALFKEQTRLTPNVYWNMLRMEEARRQLQSSQDPLMSVACNLGFTTQGNFSRFFRDHVGVPPIQYREAARGPH
jgi:AraC-like DNA-binding protein